MKVSYDNLFTFQGELNKEEFKLHFEQFLQNMPNRLEDTLGSWKIAKCDVAVKSLWFDNFGGYTFLELAVKFELSGEENKTPEKWAKKVVSDYLFSFSMDTDRVKQHNRLQALK